MRANIGEEYVHDDATLTKKDEKRLLEMREEPALEDSEDEGEVLYEET